MDFNPGLDGPAMTYFRTKLPKHYRRRCPVLLLSSEWGQVVPRRFNHWPIQTQIVLTTIGVSGLNFKKVQIQIVI